MKLGKVNQLLILLLGLTLSMPVVMAQEVVDTKQQMVVDDEKEMDEEERIQTLSDEEMMQLIKTKGVKVGKSKEMDGLKITVEYIWADSHYEKALICIEHLDKSPFPGPGQSYLGQGYGHFGEVALKNKKEYEAYSLQQKKFRTLEKLLAEDATITEIVRAYAAIDSNYKKFIRKDGTVDQAGAEAAIDAEFEATSTEISVLKECNVKEDMPYKKHFILNGGQKNTRTAGQMVLHLGKYREMAETDIDITPALVEYLSTQPAQAQTKIYEPSSKNDMKDRPEKVLANQDLQLKVAPNFDAAIVKGVGFVGDNLHLCHTSASESGVQILLMFSSKEFRNLTAQELERLGEVSVDKVEELYSERKDVNEAPYKQIDYHIYHIKDLEQLKKCRAELINVGITIDGKANCTFDIDLQPVSDKVMKLNKQVPFNQSEKCKLETVIKTDLSLTLKIAGDNGHGEYFLFLPIFTEDGEGSISPTVIDRTDGVGTYVYDISNIKGKIKKIMIGDVEVKLD